MTLTRTAWAGLVAVMAVGACGTSHSADAAGRRTPADCTPSGFVTQSITGRVTACLRVGPIAPGRRSVDLTQALTFPPFSQPPTGRPPAEPAVTLRLSPASGRPGTVVTVTGRLRRPFRPRSPSAKLCWNGCQTGLDYGQPDMTWTSPTSFRSRIRVPAAPWIQAAPYRVAPLASGTYAIGLDCLRSAVDCDAVTEGSAPFRLRVAHPVAWCRTQATCAHLKLAPARARPGEVVRVTGFAPLSLPTPDGAEFENVKVRRRFHGAEVRFSTHLGARYVAFGHAPLTVAAAPRYTAVAPLAQVSDAVSQISANPANPATVAWCAGQTIATSGPDGVTLIPAATAKSALKALGFSFRFEAHPGCAAVAPLATSTGAPAGLAAAFSVTTAAGAPPFYLAALVTRDQGRTWTPIPVPHGSGPAGFGGFRYGTGGTLHALFSVSLKSPIKDDPQFDPNRAVTEVSSSDGQSFSQAPLGCPPAGPCVTFGPFAPGNCAMNGTIQTVLRSTDGGSRWSPLDFPYAVQGCVEAEFVATAPRTALLVDSASTYPVLRTTDGGATWHDIAIPRPPVRGDLTVLPDGSLVLADGVGYSGPWKLLAPGRRAWCVLRAPARIGQHRYPLSPPTVIGGRLLWLTGPAADPEAAPTLDQVPVSALSC